MAIERGANPFPQHSDSGFLGLGALGLSAMRKNSRSTLRPPQPAAAWQFVTNP